MLSTFGTVHTRSSEVRVESSANVCSCNSLVVGPG